MFRVERFSVGSCNRTRLRRDAVGDERYRAGSPSSCWSSQSGEYLLRELCDPSDPQDSGGGGLGGGDGFECERERNAGSVGEQAEGDVRADGQFAQRHPSLCVH